MLLGMLLVKLLRVLLDHNQDHKRLGKLYMLLMPLKFYGWWICKLLDLDPHRIDRAVKIELSSLYPQRP